MSSTPRLIYVHDPLCGWCYGLIPALQKFADTYPHVPIDVVPGGLVTGDRVGPYSAMADYISQAVVRLEEVTGRKPSQAFFDLITGPDAPLAASAPPSLALLQLAGLVPERAAEFAHRVQDAHFEAGRDLNDPGVYDEICQQHDFPNLDTGAIARANDETAPVKAAFDRSRRMGIRSFPTCLVSSGGDDATPQTLPTVYDPDAFIAAFAQVVAPRGGAGN